MMPPASQINRFRSSSMDSTRQSTPTLTSTPRESPHSFPDLSPNSALRACNPRNSHAIRLVRDLLALEDFSQEDACSPFGVRRSQTPPPRLPGMNHSYLQLKQLPFPRRIQSGEILSNNNYIISMETVYINRGKESKENLPFVAKSAAKVALLAISFLSLYCWLTGRQIL